MNISNLLLAFILSKIVYCLTPNSIHAIIPIANSSFYLIAEEDQKFLLVTDKQEDDKLNKRFWKFPGGLGPCSFDPHKKRGFNGFQPCERLRISGNRSYYVDE
ncbi:unnamed protein product [Candida verbasci]|uniref:Uncharacterized protein n=1 Tax=Candida verbasci TaxID=1227364 RepID=A0A9W4XB97_9ASCO|nr:unnamed protein product [Candida verbasci]